jgi:ABC-type sulfate/molybdate transport systems ATPase subunit
MGECEQTVFRNDCSIVSWGILKLMAGKLLGLLRPSGCGKTTLLQIVTGFDHRKPEQLWRLLGKWWRIRDVGRCRSSFMYEWCIQDYALFVHLTVVKNISFAICCRTNGQSQQSPEGTC